MKKTLRKILPVLALVLVVAVASVGGTIAWLTATSDTVTNTFTVGDINIELTETKGTLKENGEREFKIVPGATVEKDPKAIVKSGSENCYLYVKITNNLLINNEIVATYNINETSADWILVGESENTKLYRYKEIINTSNADVEKSVFTKVTYNGEKITKANINDLKDKKIVLQAYAHQSENTTQTVADAAANAWAKTTATTTSGN